MKLWSSELKTLVLILLCVSLPVIFANINGTEISTVDWVYSQIFSDRSSLTHNPYREFNNFINRIILPEKLIGCIRDNFDVHTSYYILCYCRDLIAGTIVYWGTASIWHFAIYHVYVKQIFTDKGRPLPTTETIVDQMILSQSSLFIYAGLPVVSELLIENNFTKAYFYIDEVGGWGYFWVYFVLYIACVELGIYWMHRTLHTNKFLYKYVHGLHHKYNQALTLTPWASIAFNPLDGILQASPYVIFLLFIPVHYFTHVFMLFFSGIWATNIHDAVWGDTEPIMGAKYHTMHHTHFHYNFGQFFTFCDQIFGYTIDLKSTVKSQYHV